MPRIRCHYSDCIFLEDGHCGAAAVELEPDSGCLTYQQDEEAEPAAEEEWEGEDFEDEVEEEEELYEEDDEEEDLWDDDDDDEEY